MSISSVGAEAASPTNSANDRAQLNDTIDNFLLMLTTQLKNQDPLSPMDNSEFTNQLIGFSTVEQLINSNEKMDQFLASQTNSAIDSLISYVGLEVEAEGSGFEYTGAPELMSYETPADARDTTITILDELGRVVYQAAGDNAAGKHEIAWSGQSFAGETAPAGIYSLRVTSLDSEGERADHTTYTSGLVTGVETTDDGTQLTVGNRKISADDVISVRIPQYAAAPDGETETETETEAETETET